VQEADPDHRRLDAERPLRSRQPGGHRASLVEAVTRYAKAPTEDLRRGLIDVGLEATDLAVNSKFDLPAGLAAPALLAQPRWPWSAASRWGAMRLHRATRSTAPVVRTTPLGIQQAFEPRAWLSRVIAAVRRASGLSN
jgi:hypothetical protein